LGLGGVRVAIRHVTLAFGPCLECAIIFKKIGFRHLGFRVNPLPLKCEELTPELMPVVRNGGWKDKRM
jgi:hypothetical protein